jgi:predicted nucleic acid-binding protein
MKRVFIDASVLFSANLSSTGASRELIRLSLQNRIALVANELVLQEVEKNIAIKNAEVLAKFKALREILTIELVAPTEEEILTVLPYTVLKDAPPLAAAIKANVYCLISLDRKHMIDVRDPIKASLGLRILLPSELLEELRSEKGEP